MVVRSKIIRSDQKAHVGLYNKANIDAIKHELNMIDWHVLLDNGSAEECWRTFKDKFARTTIYSSKDVESKQKEPYLDDSQSTQSR